MIEDLFQQIVVTLVLTLPLLFGLFMVWIISIFKDWWGTPKAQQVKVNK